jgi:hypothetical protein
VLWLGILKISGKRFLVMIKRLQLWKELIDSGIAIHFEDSIDLVPKDYFVENTWLLLHLLFLKHIQSGIILWIQY